MGINTARREAQESSTLIDAQAPDPKQPDEIPHAIGVVANVEGGQRRGLSILNVLEFLNAPLDIAPDAC